METLYLLAIIVVIGTVAYYLLSKKKKGPAPKGQSQESTQAPETMTSPTEEE